MAVISKPIAAGNNGAAATLHIAVIALVLLVALMAAPARADVAANVNNNANPDGIVEAAKAVRSDAWNLGRNLWKAVKDAFSPKDAAVGGADGSSKSRSVGGASPSASVEEEAEYKALEASYLPRFEEFKHQYNRQYATPEEEQLRLRAFIRNMEIAAEAQASNPEATFGMNALSDLTREELRQRMGARPNLHGGSLPQHPHIQPKLNPAIVDAVNAEAAKANDLKAQFEDFKVKFNRKYETPEEEVKRFEIFTANMAEVEKLRASNPHAQFGVNQFSDVSKEEMQKRKGLKVPTQKQDADVPKSDEANLKGRFEEFKLKFNRNYATPEEEAKRFEIFTANMAEVEKLRATNPHAQFGVNQFSDVSKEEMQKRKGLKAPTQQKEDEQKQAADEPKSEEAKDPKALFEEFKLKFNRKYATPEEEAKRFGIFVDNMMQMEKLRKTNPQAKFGLNQFSDVSREEMYRGKRD